MTRHETAAKHITKQSKAIKTSNSLDMLSLHAAHLAVHFDVTL